MLLSLLACDRPLTCGPDTHEELGVCVADDPVATDPTTALSFEFQVCERLEGDGRLDLDAKCVDDLCVGDTYADIVAVLGEPIDCDIWCEWRDGIGFGFDEYGELPEDDAVAGEAWIEEAFTGSTSTGLGMGVSLGCFVEDYGSPDYGSIDTANGEPIINSLAWNEGVHVFGNERGEIETIQFD